MPEALGSVLGEWLKANGLTWGALSKLMQGEGHAISHATLYDIRDGRRTPTAKTLRALASATDLPYEYLLQLVGTLDAAAEADPRLAKLEAALRSLPENQRDAWVAMCVGGARSIAREARDARGN